MTAHKGSELTGDLLSLAMTEYLKQTGHKTKSLDDSLIVYLIKDFKIRVNPTDSGFFCEVTHEEEPYGKGEGIDLKTAVFRSVIDSFFDNEEIELIVTKMTHSIKPVSEKAS